MNSFTSVFMTKPMVTSVSHPLSHQFLTGIALVHITRALPKDLLPEGYWILASKLQRKLHFIFNAWQEVPFSSDILLTIDSYSKWESWEGTLHLGITSTISGGPEGCPEGIKAEKALLSQLSIGVKAWVPFAPGASGFSLNWSLYNPFSVGARGEKKG